MATTRDYVAATTSKYFGTGVPAHRDPFYTIKRRLDVAAMCTAFGISAFTGGDIVKIIDIPDNSLVWGVEVKMVTKGTLATSTADIGDATGAANWQSNTDLYQAAGTTTFSQTYNAAVYPKLYVHATDPYITIRFDHAASDGVFDITVLCTDMNQ